MRKFILSLLLPSTCLFLSACHHTLLEKNRFLYDQKCQEDGLTKGTDAYALCIQLYYHKDEDHDTKH